MGLFGWFKNKPSQQPMKTPEKIARKEVSQGVSSPTPKENALVHSHLNEKEQRLVCALLAKFEKPKKVSAYVADKFGKDIRPESLSRYTQEEPWRSLVARYRLEYIQNLDEVALKHKKVRFEELTEVYQEAKDQEVPNTVSGQRAKRRELADYLRDAEVMDRQTENVTNILAVQMMSDEELTSEMAKLAKEIKQLGGDLDAKARLSTEQRTQETGGIDASTSES